MNDQELGTGYAVKDFAERARRERLLQTGYPVNDFPERPLPVNDILETPHTVNDFSETGYAVNDFSGMRGARSGYEICVTAKGAVSEYVTFENADDALIGDTGGLSIYAGRELIAMFAPGKWTYLLDRGAAMAAQDVLPQRKAVRKPLRAWQDGPVKPDDDDRDVSR